MTTLVGTQKEFVDALYELCELDFDAVEAYQAAINKLENHFYKNKLSEFMADHQRHITEISNILQKHNVNAPHGPSAKSLLTQGKVALGELFGDESILRAMLSNEIDTNTAYERLNTRKDEWEDAKNILARGLQDEQKHRAWLEEVLRKEEAA